MVFGCFGSKPADAEDNKAKEEANKRIEKQLEKDKKDYKSTHRLLLLGAGESGKSTIVKQMRILHINGFSPEEKRQKVEDIKRNIKDAILTITGAMGTIDPPEELELESNKSRVDYVQNLASHPDIQLDDLFYEHCIALWRDKGVQRAFDRSHEYQLIDCAQ